MVYVCGLLILLCIEYFFIFNAHLSLERKQNLFLLLGFIEISLFIGMRDTLSSVDTAGYLTYFYDIGNSVIFSAFRENEFEWGYTYLNKVVYWIFGYNQVAILTVVGALTIGPVLWTLRARKYLLLSVLTWCIMNGLTTAIGNQRQGMALGWCLLGYYHIMNRKNWWGTFAIIIASSFHFSAICMLATIPLYYLAKKLKFSLAYFLGLILPSTIILMLIIRPLLVFFTETSGMYNSYLNRHNSATGAILYCIVTGMVFLSSYISYYYRHKHLTTIQRTNFKFLLLMALFGFVMYLATINGGSNRMALYFTCVYVWLFPILLDTLANDKKWQFMASISIYVGLAVILAGFYFFPSSFEAAKYTPFFIVR